MTIRKSVVARCAWLPLTASLLACGSEATLVVRPTTPTPADLVPTPQLQEYAYKQLLVLGPEVGVAVDESIEIPVVKERGPSYYMGRLEKLLLSQGFQVISSEIVARVGQKASGAGSQAARALVMGKETHADAVLMVQSIAVAHADKFYHLEDFAEVEPGLRVEEDGEYRHKETEACLFRLPFYEVRMEAKMIDVQTGNVLWVGSARETMLDALKESWTAKLDDDCKVENQSPFIYKDELASEEAFERTVSGLYERMFSPLKKLALTGKSLVKEEPKKVEPPPPPPPPPPKEEPKLEKPVVKTAVISSPQAVLREGPGKREMRIRVIPRKAKVEVVEVMGEWVKIKVQDGGVGWMHESMLIVND